MEEKEIKVRKDINGMVADIKLVPIKTRFSERTTCQVKLYNGVVFEFLDDNNLFALLNAARQTGTLNEVLKSRKLVEEVKNDSVIGSVADEATGTYVCVLYELNIGGIERTFRLFMSKPLTSKPALDIYYANWKKMQSTKSQQGQVK